MPETVDIATPGLNAKIARAQRAVETFRALCPDLSILATVLAGRDPMDPKKALRVEPSDTTCTDGRTIYIRPDGRLGDTVSDDEWSDIKASLFHEIAHVVFDSFAPVSDEDRDKALKTIAETMPEGRRRDALVAHIKSAEVNHKSLAGAFHPLMPMLVNALEDARVEAKLFEAKPGTHKHVAAQRMEIFDAPIKEIEARIGKAWKDRDADSQAVIGCYLLGAGYDPENRLTDKVAEDLRSIEATVLAATTAGSVEELYVGAFDVLTGLQALGYLRNGDERDEPQPDDGTDSEGGIYLVKPGAGDEGGEETEIPEGSIVITLPSDEDDTPEKDDEGEGEAAQTTSKGGDEPEVDESEGGQASEGDETDDDSTHGSGAHSPEGDRDAPDTPDAAEAARAVAIAGGHHHHSKPAAADLEDGHLKAALAFEEEGYTPTEQPALGIVGITRVTVASTRGPDTREDRPLVERAIAQVMPELREALAVNSVSAFSSGLRAGRVDTRSLYRVATGSDRIFGRYEVAEQRDYLFVMMLDCSGSMGGSQHRGSRFHTMKHTAMATGEMLDRIGVPFLVYGYSGDRTRGKTSWADLDIFTRARGARYTADDGEFTLKLVPVRDHGQQWDDGARARLMNLRNIGANLDGSTMQWARMQGRRAARHQATEVVVLYFNDGGMPAENRTNEERLIRWEVRNQARNHVHYVGVGINSDDVETAGLELVACNNPEEGARNLTRRVAQILGVRR